ncbi:unnamed protein product [Blepharisma stoltei]|uniref:Uncharacterized protein n=1 Tax=Blepharisma stoltei TaxID=1481888 RepID=A0AAU9IUM2_9CILI|nr:unnamed protein product [Blepharisma stoltei]
MEIPVILEDLKDKHKIAFERDEITNFREDLLSLIHESCKKGYLRGIGKRTISVPDFSQNNYINKINCLLPKQSQVIRFNIFSLFARITPNQKIFINIPQTIIRTDESSRPYLIQTEKDGCIVSKPFLNKTNFFEYPKKTDESYPYFVYRVHNKEPALLFSKENAEEVWDSFDGQAMMQRYIECRSNPVSVIRVLWKKNMKNKYFTIVNRNKYDSSWMSKKMRYKKAMINKNKSFSSLSDFKYSNMILPTTQSINNPYKLIGKPSCSKLSRSTSCFHNIKQANSIINSNSINLSQTMSEVVNNDKEEMHNPESIKRIEILREESSKDLIINTKNSESCYAVETFIKIPEIEAMVNQIITFLTTDIYPRQSINGMVFDFIQDKNDNNWAFLSCREQYIDFKFPLDIDKVSKLKLKLKPSRRSLSTGRTEKSSSTETEHRSNQQEPKQGKTEESNLINVTLPFKFKENYPCKSAQKSVSSDKDLIERANIVNERLGHIITQKTPICFKNKDIRQESIQYYQRYNHRLPNDSLTPQCPAFKSYSAGVQNKIVLSSMDEKSIACAQRALRDAIDNFDEMAMNVEISKVKRQNLVEKYGGISFWNSLIVSLYNKVLSNDKLNKYFKNTRMEDFEVIVSGMFKIFNGKMSLEFRRAMRKNHQGRGITDSEYWCYAEIYEQTLKEFNIDEEDQKSIMSQIRSMKGLIVR